MVLKDHLSGIVQSGADGGQLYQHFGTVFPFLHHALYFLQVADGTGQPVDYGFLVFVDMAVGMGNAVLMQIGMVVIVAVFMVVGVFMALTMGMRMVQSGSLLFRFFSYYTVDRGGLQATRGDIF